MLDSILASGLTLPAFLVCTAVSLVLGIATAFLSMYRSKCSQGFAVTVAVLPAIVQIVILLVNGNVGAGVAVAGAFSLVRFRSVPGTAREIGVIFLAMALGLATGMGYVTLAAVFFVIIAAVLLLMTRLDFGTRRTDERLLKITIPENLDYDGLFDDLFDTYTTAHTLERVWGWDSDAEINVVWVHISNLRKKLKGIGSCVTIRANRGLGYVLEAGDD